MLREATRSPSPDSVSLKAIPLDLIQEVWKPSCGIQKDFTRFSGGFSCWLFKSSCTYEVSPESQSLQLDVSTLLFFRLPKRWSWTRGDTTSLFPWVSLSSFSWILFLEASLVFESTLTQSNSLMWSKKIKKKTWRVWWTLNQKQAYDTSHLYNEHCLLWRVQWALEKKQAYEFSFRKWTLSHFFYSLKCNFATQKPKAFYLWVASRRVNSDASSTVKSELQLSPSKKNKMLKHSWILPASVSEMLLYGPSTTCS